MPFSYLVEAVDPAHTPQTEALPGQVQNSAGAFSFPVDDWTRLDRFLILGSEGGSYYASERKLTAENVATVQRCLATNGPRTVQRIAQISHAGRAPKNDQAIFALAIALKKGDEATRKLARRAVPSVCRTGTHIFQLAEAVNTLGGWGRNTCKAFTDWYALQSVDDLAYQVAKYQQRNGWSHLDVLRLAHVGTRAHSLGHEAVYRWIHRGAAKNKTNPLAARAVTRDLSGLERPSPWSLAIDNRVALRFDEYPAISSTALPRILHAFDEISGCTTAKEAARVIVEHGLPRECVPSQFLNDPVVWDALLPYMPITALIRNLGKMSEVGLLTPLSNVVNYVCTRIGDTEVLRKARVHPIALLLANSVYASGHGIRGGLSWTVVQPVVQALEEGFYAAFSAIEPTNKRRMICLDVSGSMDDGCVAGTPLTPREASAAMACVTARTEPQHYCVAFTADAPRYGYNEIRDFPVGNDNLRTIVEHASRLPMGDTDCSLPILHALKNKIPVDAFEIYTDSETWAGEMHAHVALQKYRQAMGIPAKMIVVGMVSNGFSIADPNDAGMLDVVGFDAAAPQVMADFIRG